MSWFVALAWDGTVTLGAVMQIVTFIGGLIVLYVKLSERLLRIETQVEPMWHEFAERRKIARRREDVE